jgi:hypothetical protein
LTPKKAPTKVNQAGQHWTPQSKALRLRLPKELKDGIIEQARVKGDLARVVLFALHTVDLDQIDFAKTRKVTGLTLSPPQAICIGAKARAALKERAEQEGISVNSLMIDILTVFLRTLKRDKTLREELKLELRTLRGIPITE